MEGVGEQLTGSQGFPQEEQLTSFANVHGEWETRPISIMGVVKRFISQLSYGQDLTRIAMPSEFLNPYSVLELAAIRYMSKFSILLEANKTTDPVERMLAVLHWFAVCMVEAKMYKKPYNPVVGESHYCYVTSDEYGPTRFVGEQVSHHPPVSAVYVTNDKENVSVSGTLSFGVKFWLNSVSIGISGGIKVVFANHNEEYVFSKAIPDMILKNVVFGTRKMRWTETMNISCEKTKCKADIRFNPNSNDDALDGKITLNGDTVVEFDGSIDASISYQKGDDDEKELHNASEHVPANIIYPPQRDQYPSMKIWRDVSIAIMKNEMTDADKAKQVVEEEQRRRIRTEGADSQKEHKYFRMNEASNAWEYKSGSLCIPSLDDVK